MRALPFLIIALSSTMLTACSPDFDAGEKKNKEQITSDSSDLQRKLAMASEAGGDLASAERMYTKLAENNSPQTSIELAAFYRRNNQAEKAVSILDTAYAANPNDFDLMRALANSLISAGRAQRALELLDGAIASGTNSGYIYNSRGVALDTLGKYSQAQQSYQKALSLTPNEEADFKTNLSMSHILAGEYTTAIETLEPMMKTKGSTPQSRQNLALAYGLLGDMDTAMRIGSKDISLKQMKENIRFYQQFSESKGISSLKKNVPVLPLRDATTSDVSAAEGELPPPPPPMKNLTQYAPAQAITPAVPVAVAPVTVAPVAVAPVAVAPVVVAPVAQSPSPPPEKLADKAAAVAHDAGIKTANPNFVDQFTPSPKPLQPVRMLPPVEAAPAAAVTSTVSAKPMPMEPVQHKMLTTKPAAPKETGIVPASEMPKAQEDDLKNEDVLNLQPSAGGNKKQAAELSSSDILNSREAAKFMDENTPNEVQKLQPSTAPKKKRDAELSSSDILNSREAAKFMDESPAPAMGAEVQKLQPSAGAQKKAVAVKASEEESSAEDAQLSSSDALNNREAAKLADKPLVPVPVLKPDSW